MADLAVILAAGLGSRLKNRAGPKPKGFVEIGGKPIIERSLEILLENGISRVLIGTGHLAGFYESLAAVYPEVETVHNSVYASSGSFFTLYNMKEHINEDFLLLESDLIYEARAVSTLCSRRGQNVILASAKTGSRDEVYIETDREGRLVNMSKHKSELNRIHGELVGITRLCATDFKTLVSLYDGKGPEVRRIEYETALIMLARFAPVHVERVDDLVWAEIDTEAHLKRARQQVFPLLERQGQENKRTD